MRLGSMVDISGIILNISPSISHTLQNKFESTLQ